MYLKCICPKVVLAKGVWRNSSFSCHLGQPANSVIGETALHFEKAPTLYMNEVSPPARGAMLVACALGVPLNLVTINIFEGEQLTPEYEKKNPLRLIPLLEENHFTVGDSHAIAGYLATAYGRTDELYPKEPRKRARVDQMLHFDSSVLFINMHRVILPLLTGTGTSILESSREKVYSSLAVLEKYLEEYSWVAGDSMTIADLCCLATTTTIDEFIPVTSDRFPKVYDWMETCRALPYYEKANGIGVKQFGKMIRAAILE